MKKLQYLHCVIDEKFIDGAISLFEADKSINNTFVQYIVGNTPTGHKFIKDIKCDIHSIRMFAEDVLKYDVVVLHSLTSLPLQVIAAIPNRVKVVWLMWGADFYKKEVCDMDLIYPQTRKALSLRNRLGEIKANILYSVVRKAEYSRALSRIDFFSGVFPYEYDLFKGIDKYEIHAEPLDFYYGSTDFFIPEEPNVTVDNRFTNIIIGNSADPRNNTIDAFSIINKELDIEPLDNIIVPLSYGNNKTFKKNVKEYGHRLWGDKFNALDTYLPLPEYLQLVTNCKSAVFFHERQQASDNVLLQMLYGARVFMSEKSLMFQYLKRQGYKIFSLQTDVRLINFPMNYEEVMWNRKLLSENYSSSKLVNRVIVMNQVIKQSLS